MSKDNKEETILTLNDRVDRLMDDVLSTELEELERRKLTKGLAEIVKRVAHPEAYCPKCDDNLFQENGDWVCINCGFKREVGVEAKPIIQENPQVQQAKGKVPDQVENLIKEASNTNGTTQPKNPNIANKIKNLRDQAHGESSGPTNEDIQQVKGDHGVANPSNINWV